MELISNNIIEPWLYGSSTGLSATAIIVSATFWTWLWGAGGLLLATPLTVCFAVLGKHIPALGFLDILLGERPPIAPEHRFYQRLLAGDRGELDDMVSDYAERGAAIELFDDVILPALHIAEMDAANGNLEQDELKALCRQLREALQSIEVFPPSEDDELQGVVIIPARTESEALAAAMLAYVLRARGVACTAFSENLLVSQMQSRLSERPDVIVCLSTLTPTAARTAGTVFKRLGTKITGSKLLGFWCGNRDTGRERLNQPGVEVLVTLAEAVRFITATDAKPPEATEPPKETQSAESTS
jgi:hypothetical protein